LPSERELERDQDCDTIAQPVHVGASSAARVRKPIAKFAACSDRASPTTDSMNLRALVCSGMCLFGFGVLGCGGDGGSGGDKPASTTASDPTCASGLRWTGGNEESALMHPGGTCISCHEQHGEGPTFGIAGTVFAAQHEKTDCFGASSSQVVVTDSDGRTVTMDANEAGNFMHEGAVTFPVQAKVFAGGKTREMLSPAPSGDCNTCHTDNGDQGAPGRIFLP
jgi:cytochrome c553